MAQRFSVCVRTLCGAIRWNKRLENPAPEGHPLRARRFSAEKSGKVEQVLEGRLKFSRTLFSAAMTGLLSLEALATEVKQ